VFFYTKAVEIVVNIRTCDYLRVSAVLATATWLAGCPSHPGIVSKRLNLSENFFDHLKIPITLVSWDPCADTKFQREPLQGGVKYRGVGKLAIFVWFLDGYRRLYRKRCEIGRWLLWNVNRKSWVPDWTV